MGWDVPRVGFLAPPSPAISSHVCAQGFLLRNQHPLHHALSCQALRNLSVGLSHTAASSTFLNQSSLRPPAPTPARPNGLPQAVACRLTPTVAPGPSPGAPTHVLCRGAPPGGVRWLDAVSLVSGTSVLTENQFQLVVLYLILGPPSVFPVLGSLPPPLPHPRCSLASSPLAWLLLSPPRAFALPVLLPDVFPCITHVE